MGSLGTLDSIPWHSEHGSSRSPTSLTDTTTSRPRGYPKPLGRGGGFPIMYDGRYVHQYPTSYTLTPSPRRHGRSFVIRSRVGEKVYSVNPKNLSFRETKTLNEYRSQASPILRMHQQLFSARSTIIISDEDHETQLILQKASIVNCNHPNIQGFLKHRKTHHDLLISAEEDGRKFSFRDRRSNQVATGVRYRTTKRGDRPKQYAYKIYINPGYDISFFLMATVALFEIWQE